MRSAPSELHQSQIALRRAPERQARLRQRDDEREDEREMTQLDDHGPTFAVAAPSCQCPDFFKASTTSARHVFLVVLGQHLGRAEAAVAVERAFDHDTLPLAEEIGQSARHR